MAKIDGRVPLTAGVGGKVIGYVDVEHGDESNIYGMIHVDPEFTELYGLHSGLGVYSISGEPPPLVE